MAVVVVVGMGTNGWRGVEGICTAATEYFELFWYTDTVLAMFYGGCGGGVPDPTVVTRN